MWTTILFAAILTSAVGESDQLTLTNVRSTHGYLGPERHDNKLLPVDAYWLAFDIEGLKVEPDGKVQYSMAMEVTNGKDKVVYARDPRDLVIYNSLGGSRVQGSVWWDVTPDQAAGEYTVKVIVADRATKASQSFKRSFQVLDKSFGLTKLAISYDSEGRFSAPPGGVTGQMLWLNFWAVGFERDSRKKQPAVAVEMRVLDENGKPTLPKPFTGEVNQLDQGIVVVPMQFGLALNRPGKFTVELQATDRITKKTAKLSFPLTVIERKAADASEQK